MKEYDAIVVGAGLSGITCSGYLAKAGKKVLILEKLPEIGGCTIPNSMQGMTVSMIASFVGLSVC